MAKQFLDASGLNQYTLALKNGTLKAGYAIDASMAEHVDAKGIIGIIPLKNIPQGALERLVIVQTVEQMLALSDLQNGDSVKVTNTKTMYIVVDDTKLGSMDAFVEYAAGTAVYAEDASHANLATNATNAVNAQNASTAEQVEWSGVQNKPTEFKPEAHTHKSTDVSALAGYSVAGSYTAVANGDSLNVALGKIEKKALDASNTAAWGSITGKPETFPVDFHTQDGSTIVGLDGYETAASYSDIEETDTLIEALGKIEKKALDSSNTAAWGSITGKPSEFTPALHTQDASTITKMTGYNVAGSYSAVSANDSLEVAIGKVEKKALDSSNTAAWGSITGKPSEYTPANHDAAKVTSINGYSTTGVSGDVEATDNLATALAKIEVKADAGADKPIPKTTIDAIIAGSYTPTA